MTLVLGIVLESSWRELYPSLVKFFDNFEIDVIDEIDRFPLIIFAPVLGVGRNLMIKDENYYN